jgi:colanic acid/amylovoran biosynthesis glycosyltransferase
MKIAVFVCEFPKLSETFILNQIIGLIKAGHDVDIFPHSRGDTTVMHEDMSRYELLKRTYFTPDIPHNWFLRFLKALWLFITHLHRNPLSAIRSLNILKYGHKAASLLLFNQIIAVIRGRGEYDIIHCHFGQRGNDGLIFMELEAIKGKLIVSFHGMDANVGSLEERKQLYRKLFVSDACFTANTLYTKGKLIELGCKAEKIFQLYSSLWVDNFPFHIRIPKQDGRFNLLSIARLTEKKGLYYSIQAFKKMVDAGFNTSYHIVGDGPLKEELMSLSSNLGLGQMVKFHGALTQEAIREVAEQCHIFVLASIQANNGDSEGQGLVLQEAQAMGMPVISTRHNGIPEGVLEGKSAFLVAEKDVDALAERMIFLATNPQCWLDMGHAGRKFVEENFDTSVLNQRMIGIYGNLLDEDRIRSKANK